MRRSPSCCCRVRRGRPLLGGGAAWACRRVDWSALRCRAASPGPALNAHAASRCLPCRPRPPVNVAGFIYVQDVDLAKGTLTYLAPCAGALPSPLLLAGAFKTYLD